MNNTTQNKGNAPTSDAKASKSSAEKQSKLYKSVALAASPYFLDIEDDRAKTNLIDAQFALLSSLNGLIDVHISLAGALPEKEEIQIRAGSFYSFGESIQRQLEIMEVVNSGISAVIFDLKRDHEKQCEAYELQLSVLRQTCEALRGDQS